MSAREIHPFAVPIARAVIRALTGDGSPSKDTLDEVAWIISSTGQVREIHNQLFRLRKAMSRAEDLFNQVLLTTGTFGLSTDPVTAEGRENYESNEVNGFGNGNGHRGKHGGIPRRGDVQDRDQLYRDRVILQQR